MIGQWLEIPEIISLHYQDLIDQSVGRNRGFRDQGAPISAVICGRVLADVIGDGSERTTLSRLNSLEALTEP